jgi:predicted 2-oxoglutarate/Fe(II)-dependent dioxygenase YbiX
MFRGPARAGDTIRQLTESKELYVLDGFLDVVTCRQIQDAMDAGLTETAEVLDEEIEVRDEVRRVASIEVDPAIVAEVEQRFDGQREPIAAFFGVALAGREGAGFLRYADGGFYRAHRDRASVASWPDAARRAIALVVFLNGSRDQDPEGAFGGGALRLFAGHDAIDVVPRRGTLVAFPADLLHEVLEVVGGTRDTIVDWLYDGSASSSNFKMQTSK